ncbi:unnamed protein product [Protopolystoma xenopodis]|uniref:Uncharacterized protein n=1 Tax=Protopolystoma xenopodis TaxID=117903 RepID=A0A448XSR1_9PLAT|nr:unnamed protein product [Protopolystoma xenopodis]
MTATSNAPLESGTAGAIVAFTGQPDPLRQLLQALSRSAMEQASDDPLYLAYARIMSKSCSAEEEEEEEEGREDEGGGPTLQVSWKHCFSRPSDDHHSL